MPQPKRKLVNLSVGEVSLVPDGDNGPAKIVLYKRKPEPPPSLAKRARTRFYEGLAALRKSLGREPSAEVRKQLYDEVRDRQRASQVYEALMQRTNALAQSLESIIWWPNEDEQGREPDELIRETVRQFADSIERDAADLIAGRISKRLQSFTSPPGLEALEAALREEVDAVAKAQAKATDDDADDDDTPADPPPHEGEPVKKSAEQILAGLPAEERETMQAAIAKAKGGAADPPADDPLAKLPAAVQKQLADERTAREAEITKLRAEGSARDAEIAKLRAERERETFAKTVTFKGLATPTDELVEILFDLPVEKRDKLVKTLSAASAAVERVKLFGKGVGVDLPGAGSGEGGVLGRVEAQARELMKANPKLTIEKARTQVFDQNPELYDEYEEELAVANAH